MRMCKRLFSSICGRMERPGYNSRLPGRSPPSRTALNMPRSQLSSYFRGLSPSTAWLALGSFFADVSTEMLYPVLPIFLTETLGANGSVVGLIEGAASATQNIVQGFSGWISDKLRRRKSIALVGYALAAIAKPLMGASATWPGVLSTRMLDRFG